MAGQRGGQEQANGERGKENESGLTVVLALGANLGIAVAKGFAALITGSASPDRRAHLGQRPAGGLRRPRRRPRTGPPRRP
ncbi:hypothetical protein [Actinomadura latina]|uniref:Cation transporter n=1 Tax=Actinomadura latina TaxID=163603 RepID=A0A846Z620_9ACTN|nr:hypothetical protein [Actinomadura latina]NKZ08479.1 hypothetical protein [Actinomadura latina]